MFDQRTPLPEPKSKIVDIILGLILFFFFVILPILQLFLGISRGASEPYLDDSSELEAQDAKAKQWVEDEERKQQQKERQEEYEDYLLWLREADGR